MPSQTLAKSFLTLLCIIPRVIASPININYPPTRQLIPRMAISPDSSSSSSPKTDIILHIAIVLGVLVFVLLLATWIRHARKQRGRKQQHQEQQQRAKLSLREYAYKPPPYTGTTSRDVPLPPYEPQPAAGHTVLQGGLAEPASAHMTGGVVR